jgi:molybdopterin-synthase adenylyltransferase
MFSPEEIERYARHIVLRGIGGPGQQKLKAARVLVVGAGGLGSPLIQYLAAAGIGEIGILDDDEVSLSNLQRQVLHGTSDIGHPKVDSARDAVARLNPHVRVVALSNRLTSDNARAMIRAFDIVADGSDNFATRYAVSDACFYERRPLVTAAVGTFDGALTVLRPYEKSPSGEPNPSYRCLYPEPPPEGTVPACAEAGVLGALTGILGAMMALEVIREIVGFGEGLVGRLLLVDALNMRFETLRYRWDPENPLHGTAAADSKQSYQNVSRETFWYDFSYGFRLIDSMVRGIHASLRSR